ncbi:helix-turn-helix transcriptional regulator [uncultured Dysosmobacter sp.]|uniref:helix-turn-helix transcriptional regulator n=1 Tax=uncultured Dysosmobacter sp. TaxID=2591384 RepID=UPI00262D9A08|nr:helix-turn-helix transcriptional regulator [uncultured Dysosmobacter sp.]
MKDESKLKMECAIDALYLIGNELRHCDSDCMEEAGNALYLLQEIMRECLAAEQGEAGKHTAVSMDTGPSWLEKIRLERGISQKAVADAAGISQPTYCNIEKGKRGVSVETAKRIAAELGFEWTRFFDENSESA